MQGDLVLGQREDLAQRAPEGVGNGDDREGLAVAP